MISVSGAGNGGHAAHDSPAATRLPTLARIDGPWHRCVSNFFSEPPGGTGSATMTDWDRDAFENAMIDDMRAHGGAS